MPCMNSTSATDDGGRTALVEGGSVLVGIPGAPGCTTTGCGGLVCRAWIAEEKKTATKIAARNPSYQLGTVRGARRSRRKGKWKYRLSGLSRKVFIWTRGQSCHGAQDFSKRAGVAPAFSARKCHRKVQALAVSLGHVLRCRFLRCAGTCSFL